MSRQKQIESKLGAMARLARQVQALAVEEKREHGFVNTDLGRICDEVMSLTHRRCSNVLLDIETMRTVLKNGEDETCRFCVPLFFGGRRVG